MNITLRKKKGIKKTSLYLDIYHKGERNYEYLGLYLINKPKTPIEKNLNIETLNLAENIAAQRQLQFQNNLYGFNQKENGNLSFIDYFTTLMEKRSGSDGNYGNWKSTLKHLIKFSDGEIQFSDIDSTFLEQLKSYLLKEVKSKQGIPLSQNTSLSYFNKVRAAIKQAIKEGLLKKDPLKIVSGIKEKETEIEFLFEEEINKLKEVECDIPVLKASFLFCCYTGLRFSDVQKLKWGDIQYSNKENYNFIRYRQKKTKRPELLPIPETALNLCGERLQPNELVFTDLKYSDRNNKKLRIWMQKANIHKHITFHGSRHTYTILLLQRGTDIYTVSKMLGHSSLKTTERYAKVIDIMKINAIKKLDL